VIVESSLSVQSRVNYSRLLRAVSSWVFSIFKDEDSIPSGKLV